MFWKKNLHEYAPIALRLALGSVFVMHGSQKLFGAFSGPGITGFQGFLSSLHVIMPAFFSIVVASVEFFGGILMILGLFTRYAALLGAIDMFFAFWLVHMKKGFFSSAGGYEFVLALFLIAAALVLTGSGKFSLDRLLFKKDI